MNHNKEAGNCAMSSAVFHLMLWHDGEKELSSWLLLCQNLQTGSTRRREGNGSTPKNTESDLTSMLLFFIQLLYFYLQRLF